MTHLLTIGLSTHTIEHFVGLLKMHRVEAIADVRSLPASRFTPQFNREALRSALDTAQIRYVFLGKELGARSSDPRCYVDGKVQYSRLAQTAEFSSGIARLIDGASRSRIAIVCTEQEALDCHRTVLVSRVLAERGAEIEHIHRDGTLETHEAAMLRLRAKHNLAHPSLIDTEQEMLLKALELQEAEIAYVAKESVAG